MDPATFPERLAAVETAVSALRILEPTLQFFHSNVDFFKNLAENLDKRLTMLENAVLNGVPDQIIASNARLQDKILQNVEITAQASIKPDLKSIRNTVDEFRRSATALYVTKSDLSAALEPLSHGVSMSAKPVATRKKIPTPEAFSGKREDWKSFSNHLSLYFTASGTDYSTDSDKIVFAVSRLGDTSAFRYMETYLEEFSLPTDDPDRSSMTTNYRHFSNTMRKTFGIQNADVVAGAQLRSLRQRGSAMDYTTKFREIASDLAFNDAALIDQYRLGLKDEVLDTIDDQDRIPTTFEDYAALAITIDNRKYARSLDKKSRNTAPSTTTTRTHTIKTTQEPRTQTTPRPALPATGPTPMDLGQVKHISAEEKARRRADGSCLYCGTSGHFADKCPAKKKAHLSAVQADEDEDDSSEVTFHVGKD